MSGEKVPVLIAEDHATVREGMRLIIGREPDMEVVGEAADGREAVRLSRELEPDVVLMDISMPGMDGPRATRELQGARPRVKVPALTRHHDYGYLSELFVTPTFVVGRMAAGQAASGGCGYAGEIT